MINKLQNDRTNYHDQLSLEICKLRRFILGSTSTVDQGVTNIAATLNQHVIYSNPNLEFKLNLE